MRRTRRVKIVATLGPASYAPEMIERLFEAGVDVFRINMSHSPFDLVRKVHSALRNAEARFGRPIGILCDLQGPKFRVGNIGGERASLAEGATFRFDRTESDGGAERVFLPHPQIFEAVEPGHTLLLDDGKIRMFVTAKGASSIDATVLVGGTLASRKGISLPDTVLPIGPLTDKDKQDLDFALRLGRRLGGAVVRAARRGRQARPPAGGAGRLADVQDREAGRDPRSREHHCPFRRADGGARRPRRRAARRARARPAEADRQQGARRRQAGGGGDADAGEHDLLAGADQGRGVGRGDRRVRRGRCGDAVGRVRGRQISDRGDPHHGPHRHPGRGRPELRRASCTPRARRRRRPPPTPSPPPPTPSPTRSTSPASSATRRPARPPCASPASAPACR